ncbi:MAG: hypothetical protein ACLRWP_19610 [Bilophila wadsworthia]
MIVCPGSWRVSLKNGTQPSTISARARRQPGAVGGVPWKYPAITAIQRTPFPVREGFVPDRDRKEPPARHHGIVETPAGQLGDPPGWRAFCPSSRVASSDAHIS